MIQIFKNYSKINLILVSILIILMIFIDKEFLLPSLIGYLVAIVSFILNYKGSFFFLGKMNNTFGFFVMVSFFMRILLVISIGIILTLKSQSYLAPYIIGYSLNLISIIYIALKKERRTSGDKRHD